jgi:hypothetical protein
MATDAPGYVATHAGLRSAPLEQAAAPDKHANGAPTLDNYRTKREH